MRISFAPMEGITLAPFRNAHAAYYGGVDDYYAPFIAANQTKKFKSKEIRDILPENNRTGGKAVPVVPQILTVKPDQLAWAVRQLHARYGFQEINLNLGCPSPTVVTKGKGAGLLKDKDYLYAFFQTFFDEMDGTGILTEEDPCPVRFTVKTRIGLEEPAEALQLLKIYNDFPISEVIVHPRVGALGYRGIVNLEAFELFYKESIHPVCYNGDIRCARDAEEILARFPDLAHLMIGRGLVARPDLAEEIRTAMESDMAGAECGSYGKENGIRMENVENAGRIERLAVFLQQVYANYEGSIQGEVNILNKMKEIWAWLLTQVPAEKKAVKVLQKARSRTEYEAAAAQILGTAARL